MNIIEVDARTGRRETPTASLVLSVDAPRLDWLEARRSGITATDLPAILGLSSYKTAIDVWTDKTMPPVDNEPGEAAFWGTRLEEPVAQAWAERRGVRVRRIGLVRNDEKPWMLASLDRLVHGCADGRCALEVKTRSLFVSDTWEKALPDDVKAQVMWQLAVTGLDHIHVAALIGGQRLVEHVVYPFGPEIKKLLEAAQLVWNAVLDEVLPDLPPELWSTDYLDQRHPERAGVAELDDAAADLITEYAKTTADIAYLEAQKDSLRTALIGALGNADTAAYNGRTVYTFKESSRRSLNSKALVELHPDIAADERIWTTTSSRTLRLSPRKEPK